MKLSPQLLVYDQDANRSRRFNTNVGGLLEFHCFMLYTVFPICGYMDCYLVLSQDLFITKNDYKALHWFRVTLDSVEYTRKVYCTTVSKSSQVYNRLQTSPYIEGCSVHVVTKSQWIVQSLVHTLSCMPIISFPLQDGSFSLPDQPNK